jgi:hypothetical protein
MYRTLSLPYSTVMYAALPKNSQPSMIPRYCVGCSPRMHGHSLSLDHQMPPDARAWRHPHNRHKEECCAQSSTITATKDSGQLQVLSDNLPILPLAATGTLQPFAFKRLPRLDQLPQPLRSRSFTLAPASHSFCSFHVALSVRLKKNSD